MGSIRKRKSGVQYFFYIEAYYNRVRMHSAIDNLLKMDYTIYISARGSPLDEAAAD